MIGGIVDEMSWLTEIVETVTFDNGKEFSSHATLAKALKASVYFARPHHSWERGLNENTNGLVRQYFPKKTALDNIRDDEVNQIALKLNNRPRKCLGYQTPIEVLRKLAEKRGVALRT